MAGGLGFEPRLMGPEPIVLPLDDPPTAGGQPFNIPPNRRGDKGETTKGGDKDARAHASGYAILCVKGVSHPWVKTCAALAR